MAGAEPGCIREVDALAQSADMLQARRSDVAWKMIQSGIEIQLRMKKSLGAKPFAYPTPVFVVGTYDPNGKPNVMTASWGGICCSQPPCVAVSLRKATYTHGNIVARRAFTISIPSERHVKKAEEAVLGGGELVFVSALRLPASVDKAAAECRDDGGSL